MIRTWSEAHERLSWILGGNQDAEAWIRSALSAWRQVDHPLDLRRQTRAVALQKLAGVVTALEELPGDVAFAVDVRHVVARVFARYFEGACPEGPPWRIAPGEDRPVWCSPAFDDQDVEVGL